MSEPRAAYTIDDGQVIPETPAVLLDSHNATRTVNVRYVDGEGWRALPYPLDEPEAAAAIDTAAIRSLFAEVLDAIQQEWVDHEISDQYSEFGRLYPGQEEMFRKEVEQRMATFRTYAKSKLTKLLGEG